jgi:hypothetical protein
METNLLEPKPQSLSLPLISFSTTFDDPNGKYSKFYDDIKSHVAAAGANWSKHLQGNGSLEILIKFSNPGPTVTGRSSITAPVSENGEIITIYEQGAASEIRTGIDPNGTAPDIEFNFNPDYLIDELWFDPNPSTRTAPVPTNKTDALSVLMHEFGHAFAFNGFKNATNGTLLENFQSTFDRKTSFDGTNFFFNGTKSTAIYGSAVPLTFGNISHLGNNLPKLGENLIPDLMNGVQIDRGTRYDISPLDLAILEDSGIEIAPASTVPSITLSVNPTSVKEDGATNLVYTFTRTGNLSTALTVNYEVGGTATFTTDYTQTGGNSFTATGGKINFAANASTATLIIDPTADTTIETDETLVLKLADGIGYTVGTTTAATGTIVNDDIPGISAPLVLKVENVITSLQNKQQGNLLDLRGFTGQTFKVDTIAAGSDAVYNNYIGFYAVEDEQGTLANGLKVTDAGYAEAAIRSAVLRSSKAETQIDRTVAGGKILAPVAIANGTFDEFLNRNPQNKADSNIHAYFNYIGANTDKFDHFKLLGANKFGLEDLYGGGDKDYNDLIIQGNIKS